MKGYQAIDAMMRGKKARRESWPKGQWIRYDVESQRFRDDCDRDYVVAMHEPLMADDWVIVRTKSEPRNVWTDPHVGDVVAWPNGQYKVVHVTAASVVYEDEHGLCGIFERERWRCFARQDAQPAITLVEDKPGELTG